MKIMKGKWLGLLLAVLCACMLTACGCRHDWKEADCTQPKMCKKCGIQEGDALGHTLGEWYIMEAATFDTEGSRKRFCTTCANYEETASYQLDSCVENDVFIFSPSEFADHIAAVREMDEFKKSVDYRNSSIQTTMQDGRATVKLIIDDRTKFSAQFLGADGNFIKNTRSKGNVVCVVLSIPEKTEYEYMGMAMRAISPNESIEELADYAGEFLVPDISSAPEGYIVVDGFGVDYLVDYDAKNKSYVMMVWAAHEWRDIKWPEELDFPGSKEDAEIPMIAAGAYNSVFVNSDGTVDAVGLNDQRQCAVSRWENIVAIDAYNHTVGVRENGRVLATGTNKSGQCEVYSWTDIVDVAAGYVNTLALDEDGRVHICGDNTYKQFDVYQWTDIVAIAMGEKTAYGLKADGTVLAQGSDASGQHEVSRWRNIIAIDAGFSHVVGLKEDGTVVAVGSNSFGQCDVSQWRDIVAVCAGNTFTIGLKENGTVVACGENTYGQCDVQGWSNIVAIDAGMYHTIGVTEDGQRLAVGSNAYGQCDVVD